MGKDETSEPLSKKKGDKIMRKKIAALLAMLMLGGVLTGWRRKQGCNRR